MAQQKLSPHKEDNWKGYNLDELRYERAYMQARMVIERERMASQTRNLYSGFTSMKGSSIAGKLLGSLNYLDYILLAFRIGRKALTLIRRLR